VVVGGTTHKPLLRQLHTS